MTIVDITTGELRPAYSDVRRSVEAARESGTRFFEQIVWQIENRAWEVLGYGSWDEMREAEYGDMGVVVPRADRPEIVARLRGAGMTQQKIAEAVGVDQKTVSNDLNRNFPNEDRTTITNSRGQERPASYRPQSPQGEEASAATDRGFDERGGATRAPAAPRPAASPQPARAQEAEWEAQDRAEELASNLARNVSLTYALTNPERRAEYIANWRLGTKDRPVLGADFVTPKCMRELSAALDAFASEWEKADV